jgi:hypothetical protein
MKKYSSLVSKTTKPRTEEQKSEKSTESTKDMDMMKLEIQRMKNIIDELSRRVEYLEYKNQKLVDALVSDYEENYDSGDEYEENYEEGCENDVTF